MRKFHWGNADFDSVEEVERAIRAYIKDTMKGPVPHAHDLTVVTRDARSPGRPLEQLTVKVAVFVEAKKE